MCIRDSYKAHEVNQEIIKFIDSIVAEVGKPKHAYESCAIPEELFAAIKEIVPPAEMEEAVFSDDKQTREENIRVITEKLEEAFADKMCIRDSAICVHTIKCHAFFLGTKSSLEEPSEENTVLPLPYVKRILQKK